MLALAHTPLKFEMIATTADLSIGNAYDKVAKVLKIPPHPNLGYGAALERFCAAAPIDSTKIRAAADFAGLSLVIPSKGMLQFSFSGLFSRVNDFIEAREVCGELSEELRVVIAKNFQDIATAQLEEKLKLAFKLCRERAIPLRHLVISGGVASNVYLRSRLQNCVGNLTKERVSVQFPPTNLCTDNAAMIGWASTFRFVKGDFDDYTIDVRPEWSIANPFDSY